MYVLTLPEFNETLPTGERLATFDDGGYLRPEINFDPNEAMNEHDYNQRRYPDLLQGLG
jgi:hypothetical protein